MFNKFLFVITVWLKIISGAVLLAQPEEIFRQNQQLAGKYNIEYTYHNCRITTERHACYHHPAPQAMMWYSCCPDKKIESIASSVALEEEGISRAVHNNIEALPYIYY